MTRVSIHVYNTNCISRTASAGDRGDHLNSCITHELHPDAESSGDTA